MKKKKGTWGGARKSKKPRKEKTVVTRVRISKLNEVKEINKQP